MYQHNAIVYVAGRSASKAEDSIEKLRKLYPHSNGRIEFIQLDLADLTTLKPAVANFLSKEESLHVLTLNAGVRTIS